MQHIAILLENTLIRSELCLDTFADTRTDRQTDRYENMTLASLPTLF